MNEGSCSGAPALPADVVAKVLLMIDQTQRMQSCALVSHDWNKASKLTVSKVTCKLGETAQYAALSRWLLSNSNSSNISSIEVCSKLYGHWKNTSKLHTLHLPVYKLPQLQTLSLESCRLQLTGTAVAPSGPAVTADADGACLAALTALQTLKLERCVIKPEDLRCCTCLQHLHLSQALPSNIYTSSTAAVAQRALASLEIALAVALEQLQQLTFLSVDRSNREHMYLMQFDSIFSALSSLQQLQVLEVGSYVNMQAHCLANLPIGLRRLKLASFWFDGTDVLPMGVAPHLQRLSNLQHLHLDNITLEYPELLLSCTQLTGLDLIRVDIDTSLINLLASLQNLQQLQHLCLRETLGHEIDDYESYAALTASSHLTSLDICSCFIDPQAVQHIFAAQQPCRGLLKASLTFRLLERPGSYQLLVSCCPALQTLHIVYPWSWDPDEYPGEMDQQGLDVLTALTDLTTLSINGVGLCDDSMASIAECQQLKDLYLEVQFVSLYDVWLLTRLTGLTSLSFRAMGSKGPEDLYLTNQAAADRPPDVHQQLNCQLEQQRQKSRSTYGDRNRLLTAQGSTEHPKTV